MKQQLKKTAGIDVSKNELVVSLGYLLEDFSIQFAGQKKFKNSDGGLKALKSWIAKYFDGIKDVQIIMEATGVYHESCAHYFYEEGMNVSIVLPNKISNYVRSLNLKTKTDASDAEAICQFGLERKQGYWTPPHKIYQHLRSLTRERSQIRQELGMIKNQLHAEKHRFETYPKAMKRLKARKKMLETQMKEIEKDLRALVETDL